MDSDRLLKIFSNVPFKLSPRAARASEVVRVDAWCSECNCGFKVDEGGVADAVCPNCGSSDIVVM
jgi:Zn finger protein HypA/HybF involved in hydrogenase expression